MADEPQVEEAEIDPKLDPKIQKRIISAEEKHANGGRNVGLLIIAIGVILLLLGVSGAVDMNFVMPGLNIKLAQAAPGIVLVVVGLIVILSTRLKIKMKGKK